LALLLCTGVVAAALTAPAPCRADTVTVHAGESIQAAIDDAPAGSTILVEPGVYHESAQGRALTVTKDGITLIGQSGFAAPVVLEHSDGQDNGIWVSPSDTVDLVPPADDEHPPCGVSGARVKNFNVRGFTVTGFPEFGIYLACVDTFEITDNIVTETDVYSIFPVQSAHGRILRNTASGTTDDACIYTGQDHDILVASNQASGCLLGFQIENSFDVRLTGNVSTGNTAGVFVDVIVNDQVKGGAGNVVANNLITANNRPNGAKPGTDNAGIPPGLGIAINGADATLVTHNTITDNEFAAITISNLCIGGNVDCSQPLDVDPVPDGNRIIDNRIAGNASSPSGQFGSLSADIIYLPDTATEKSQGNCFRGNGNLRVAPAGAILATCPITPPLRVLE
jgi:parallel beta-helix repeat protein